jgi:hypothetical protein
MTKRLMHISEIPGWMLNDDITEVEIVPPQCTKETSDMIEPVCEDCNTDFKGRGLK